MYMQQHSYSGRAWRTDSTRTVGVQRPSSAACLTPSRARPTQLAAAAREEASAAPADHHAAAAAATAATRRQSLAAAAAAAAALAWPAAGVYAAEEQGSSSSSGEPDLTITDRVYLDFAVADSAFKAPGDRTLGDRTIIPAPTTQLGRLEIGLYGNIAPATVRNLLQTVRSGALNGTVISRISPGEYIQAGRQGSRRLGEVEGVPNLQPNSDISSPAGFKLTHSRPGTVSLSISSDNDEDPATKDRPNYRCSLGLVAVAASGPLEFLVTTGPGPVPRLDGLNLVFGRVTSGLTTVAAVAAVPSFQPDPRSQQLNAFAKFIGDDRADKVGVWIGA
ncbi:hypothetical protein MNEG_9908 [Monoraphidium neglectum]|uniref:PPIase cyclophilin-type domain-containing protein n=1 Tax=Monoraphidium neglectum TaxID=145388 RepID=A0A0D2KR46_9CHLO|nr:hypothetical protein MNEG_9908 [Monoraphidium neglectum]KIY98053.1 hypothetical protein MNEG_9908 [Monoraphidium neglectum]|eukprot:XP_013897073.1 hypothetical protein MNEG_9908 [Monoraphidium neglectum]